VARSRFGSRGSKGAWGLLAGIGRGIAAAAAFVYVYVTAIYLTLPDVRRLATQPPATTAFMELRRSQANDKGLSGTPDRHWVPYDRISPHLKRAVLTAEDSAFFDHDGIDYDELQKAMAEWRKGDFSRGASTITQQLAKNLYLSPSRNPFRKLRELMITRLLEGGLSKRRIFEIYLNVVEWGDHVYGAEAAARTYFRVPAASLSPSQSALLAGSLINPRRYSPAHPPRRLLRRQRIILARMSRGGAISEAPRPVDAPAAPRLEEAPAELATESLEEDPDANPDEPDEAEEPPPDPAAPPPRTQDPP
jgi:monofunctional glycosyltransferase